MLRETDAPPQDPERPRTNDEHSPPSPSLPHDLVVDILSRLPVKSLIRFRCVCKAWKTLISNPQFARKQLQFSTTVTTTVDPTTNHRLLWCVDEGQQRFSSKSWPLYSIFNNRSTATVLEKPNGFETIIGSCNGLLCSVKPRNYIRIWNPTIRESKIIPASHAKYPTSYGFGYDHISDDYKVVRMSHFDHLGNIVSRQIVLKVYSLKADYWKKIGNFPYKGYTYQSGMFVNGTLNWLVDRNLNCLVDRDVLNWLDDGPLGKVVVSIDLANYKFEEVLLPDYKDVIRHKQLLGVLGGCLCVVRACYNHNNTWADRWDVWVMKEYRLKESWTKLFSIPSFEYSRSHFHRYSNLMPLWVLDNGVILFMFGSKLVLYDSKGNAFRDCVLFDFSKRCTTTVYAESLVSPNVETQEVSAFRGGIKSPTVKLIMKDFLNLAFSA